MTNQLSLNEFIKMVVREYGFPNAFYYHCYGCSWDIELQGKCTWSNGGIVMLLKQEYALFKMAYEGC